MTNKLNIRCQNTPEVGIWRIPMYTQYILFVSHQESQVMLSSYSSRQYLPHSVVIILRCTKLCGVPNLHHTGPARVFKKLTTTSTHKFINCFFSNLYIHINLWIAAPSIFELKSQQNHRQ